MKKWERLETWFSHSTLQFCSMCCYFRIELYVLSQVFPFQLSPGSARLCFSVFTCFVLLKPSRSWQMVHLHCAMFCFCWRFLLVKESFPLGITCSTVELLKLYRFRSSIKKKVLMSVVWKIKLSLKQLSCCFYVWQNLFWIWILLSCFVFCWFCFSAEGNELISHNILHIYCM